MSSSTSDKTGHPIPQCALCGFAAHALLAHLEHVHQLSPEEYVRQFPGAETVSEDLLAAQRSSKVLPFTGIRAVPTFTQSVDVAGIRVPVNLDVPPEVCLPMPDGYVFPKKGAIHTAICGASLALFKGRTTYISGPPGTGKDAFPQAWAAVTRTPSALFQIEPDADIRSWLFTKEIDPVKGSYFEEGRLLKLARDGYLAPSGQRYPALILFTDIDRATPRQMEMLRLMFDSVQRRVMGPGGVVYPVLPGTVFVMTANTVGEGDTTGRYVSARPIDSTILNRIERAFVFSFMEWEEECEILRMKFPTLDKKAPKTWEQVGNVTKAIREAIQDEKLYFDWTHRTLCNWMSAAEDILSVTRTGVPPDLLKKALIPVLSMLGSERTLLRMQAQKMIDPHIAGGVL